ASYYPAFELGLTQLLGPLDIIFLGILLPAGISGSIQFAQASFATPHGPGRGKEPEENGRTPFHRAWLLTPLLTAAIAVFAGGAFQSTQSLAPVIAVLFIGGMAHNVMMSARGALAKPRVRYARTMLVGWLVISALFCSDPFAWMGIGELAGGLHFGSAGL